MRHAPFARVPVLALGAVALAFVAGCSDPDPTGLQYLNRRPFEPDMEIYLPWWGSLEECTEIQGDLDGVRWYLADGIASGPLTTTTGEWLPSRAITLLKGYEYRRQVVQHQMLHDILRTASHDHPAWDTCVEE